MALSMPDRELIRHHLTKKDAKWVKFDYPPISGRSLRDYGKGDYSDEAMDALLEPSRKGKGQHIPNTFTFETMKDRMGTWNTNTIREGDMVKGTS